MNSLYPDICSKHLPESRDFYVALFDFEVLFEIDWYIQLKSKHDDNLQLAFVRYDHESVPAGYEALPQGVVITLETDDVDPVYKKSQKLDCHTVFSPRDEVWGQRHFMLRDPNGLLVDVVQMIEPDEGFMRDHGLIT